jgi:Ser/Thr protein kinase RdoA (MazF antagonist)
VVSAAAAGQPRTLSDVEPGAFGALLAEVHAAFDDGFVLPVGGEAWAIDVDALLGHTDRWLRRTYAELPEECQALTAWRDAATQAIAAAPIEDVGLCHGEAYPATCRAVEGGALAVAELAWAGVGPRIYDLATYRWVLALHAAGDAGEIFAAFLAGYGAHRPVPDLRALDAWVAARHLWSLRLAAGFAPTSQLVRRAELARTWPIGVR